MAYRNDLDAAHAQLDALREENRKLQEENRNLQEPEKPKTRSKNTHSKKTSHSTRGGFHYERPETLWPMFDDWHEMVSFSSAQDSDSVVSWLGSKFGFLTAILFVTPFIALVSLLFLPIEILSGIKIGRRSDKV